MPQPRAGALGASSQVQEHPPTRVLGPAGSSVTPQILTGEGGRREVAPPVPRGVTAGGYRQSQEKGCQDGRRGCNGCGGGVTWVERGGKDLGRSQAQAGYHRCSCRFRDRTVSPTPPLTRGTACQGASPRTQGAKFGAAATAQGLPPPRHRPNRDHE